MGELSYNDVRRAAQEAVQDILRSIHSEMANSREDFKRNLKQSDAGQYQLNDINSRLNVLQQQLSNLANSVRDSNPTATTKQLIHHVQQSTGDLQARLRIVEEFMHTCHAYLTALARSSQKDSW